MSSRLVVAAGVFVALVGSVAGGLGVVGALGDDRPDPSLTDHPSLRSTPASATHLIGVAVGHRALTSDRDYRALAAHDFDTITLENELKWSHVHVEPGVFDFDRADDMIEIADDEGWAVRGHTLVWHEQLPDWFDDARLGREQAIELLRTHITNVVSRYAGRITQWDVVNEPLADDGSGLRDTVWRRTIGDDYVALAFQFARDADPDAQLFLNDYDPTPDGAKYAALIELAAALRADGVPVDGVGFQHHLAGDLDLGVVADRVDEAARLGLDVAFTEVDDRLPDDAGPADLAQQARRLSGLASVCVASPACTTFVMWGLTDEHSWVPDAFPGYGHATLFDAEYRAKPAYDAVFAAFDPIEPDPALGARAAGVQGGGE